MKTAGLVLLGGIAAIASTGSTAARADVTVVQKTVIDCPGLKQMMHEIPEEQRGPLLGMMSPMLTGTPWITTTYIKGDRMREDMGETTVVVNANSGKSFTLNRQTHAYSIGPYDPFQQAAGSMTCHVRATPRKGTLLGHPIDIYEMSMTSSVLPKSEISGEIWAAPDLPTPPVPGYTTGNAAMFQDQMAKIKGLPLAYTVVYHNTPAGDIKVTSFATSISDKQLALADFRIPSDFHEGRTRMATKNPSAGSPLGDGMPLDSMNAVSSAMATGDGGGADPTGGMLGGAGGSGDVSSMLSNMSPEELQKLLAMAQSMGGDGGGGTGGVDLNGMSAGQLQQMMGAMGGGGMGDAGGGGMGDAGGGGMNMQSLQQLSGQLQSLLNDDDN